MRPRALPAILMLAACTEQAGNRSVVNDSATMDVRRAVEAQWAAHTAGALRRDAVAAGVIWADDAIYIETGAPVFGRRALDSLEAEFFKVTRVVSSKRSVLDLRVLGDAAYEIGTNDFVLEDANKRTTAVKAGYMVSWIRGSDGKWRVHRMVAEPPRCGPGDLSFACWSADTAR